MGEVQKGRSLIVHLGGIQSPTCLLRNSPRCAVRSERRGIRNANNVAVRAHLPPEAPGRGQDRAAMSMETKKWGDGVQTMWLEAAFGLASDSAG